MRPARRPSARDFMNSKITCAGALTLREGTLTVQVVTSPGARTSSGAVTGGTGAYANARGVLRLPRQRDRIRRHDHADRLTIMIKLVTALAATCACALAAPAGAGAVTLGPGAMPGLAVDAAGTAYIAWSGPGSPASLQFCRLPRGATACDIRHAIVAPGTDDSRAFVAVSGSRRRRAVPLPSRAGRRGSVRVHRRPMAGRVRRRPQRRHAPVLRGCGRAGGHAVRRTNGQSWAALPERPLDGSSPRGKRLAQLSVDHPYQATVGCRRRHAA